MFLLAIPLGVLIGLSLGALGGGGSILTVPALVYVLGQDPRDATTSSLIIVGITSLIALVPHARAGGSGSARGCSSARSGRPAPSRGPHCPGRSLPRPCSSPSPA